MIAGDLATVSALNARARADRVAAGQVSEDGVAVAGDGTAGVGDRVVTRQNDRHLGSARQWVRNGDQWIVTATHSDGTMTVKRATRAGGRVVLTAEYVRAHVELAYASTAHRAQGRTVDTAHAMVTPTTTREVLYVSTTRGREANKLYVDTFYDPDLQTSHNGVTETQSAHEVLVAVLRNEGADVAALDMIRREQADAEGMERLSAEYLTLATAAQAERFDLFLTRAGVSDADLMTVRASESHGPLIAAIRDAEARGLDIEAALPKLVAARSLADADDVAAVLHGRVDRWTRAASGRHRAADNLIAGLIPRAEGVTDANMAQALDERDRAMEDRSRTLAEQAVEGGHPWVQRLGVAPSDPIRRERWMHEVSTVAAYRDRWHIISQRAVGTEAEPESTEERSQRQRAQAAVDRAVAISTAQAEPVTGANAQVEVEMQRGLER